MKLCVECKDCIRLKITDSDNWICTKEGNPPLIVFEGFGCTEGEMAEREAAIMESYETKESTK